VAGTSEAPASRRPAGQDRRPTGTAPPTVLADNLERKDPQAHGKPQVVFLGTRRP
jgi:hypothetical protein